MAILIDFDFVSRDAADAVNAAGTVTFYDTGTTTLKTVYSDAALTTALANPYTLDGAGRFSGPVYAPDGERYAILESTSGAASIRTRDPVWGSIESGAFRSVSAYGAIGDGATDDTAAIQAAADDGGAIWFPAGTYLITNTITFGSNVAFLGNGIGQTKIITNSSLSLTLPFFKNATLPISRVRQNSNVTFKDMTFDGAGRTYITYPTSGYATKGNILEFRAINGALVENVEIKNHQSQGISDQGCRNLRIRNCIFHDNGKGDDISSPIWSQSYGSVRKIESITSANPAVVDVDAAHGFSAGQTVWIEGVKGLASVPDGEYSIANPTGTTFELTGIDTSSDVGFAQDLESVVGWAGTGANFVASEDVSVLGCHFYDNSRSGITFMPVNGGTLADCTFRNNGESSIFSNRGRSLLIKNNRITTTTLTDIIAAGIELNLCSNPHVTGNLIEDTATDALVMLGCMGMDVSQNTIVEPITDNTITYPVNPLSVDAGIDGNVITKTRFMQISSLDNFPATGAVNQNIFSDLRGTSQATGGIVLAKSGANDIVKDLDIFSNDFSQSGLAAAAMISVASDDVTQPHTINIRNSKAQGSEFPVVLQQSVAATGLTYHNIGFIPSLVQVTAHFPNAANFRAGQTWIARDRVNTTNGTLGDGFKVAIDGLTTSSTADLTASITTTNNDAWNITDGGATVLSRGEFQAWICDATNGIGFAVNAITATSTVSLTYVCHP